MKHIKKLNEHTLRDGRTDKGDRHFFTDTHSGESITDNSVANLVNKFLELDEEDQQEFLIQIDKVQMEKSRRNFQELRNNNGLNESLKTDEISSMNIETNVSVDIDIKRWVIDNVCYYDPSDCDWDYGVDQAIEDMLYDFRSDYGDGVGEDFLVSYFRSEWIAYYK